CAARRSRARSRAASARRRSRRSASTRKHGRKPSRPGTSRGSPRCGRSSAMTLYAHGDLPGCAEPFDALLDAIGFDPGSDRLWLVGDLVNRGPGSLATLRRVIALGDTVTTVLGNHDLHLLAAAAGVRRPRPSDTFGDVLDAPDAAELVDWLRRRPLLHHDAAERRVLVHAGLPPAWSVADAEREAREVEAALRGAAWREAL